MRAMRFSTVSEPGNAGAWVDRLRAKSGPLAAIVLAHAALLYFVYGDMAYRAAPVARSNTIQISYVAPPKPPAAPVPAVPETVALTRLPPPFVPPVPVLDVAPAEQAISAPRLAAAPAQTASAAPPAISAAPAPVRAPAGPKTITSGVEYLQPPQPVYPQLARRMGEQGKVILRILVDEQGLPQQVLVQTSSGFARLDEAGRQAAMRALFKPHIEDGRAVAVFVIVPLNFQLA
jgi:protein TonB